MASLRAVTHVLHNVKSVGVSLLCRQPLPNVGNLTCYTKINASKPFQSRALHLSSRVFQDVDVEEDGEEGAPQKPARLVVDVETSKKYLNSKAYKTTYGDDPVWTLYRRNHKGALPPEKTRKTCIRAGEISTGNPCPICRDEYLVPDQENVQLLEQFISPFTGEVLPTSKTGVCRKQHRKIETAIEQAWDAGSIEKPLPTKTYDYRDYYPQLRTGKKAFGVS